MLVDQSLLQPGQRRNDLERRTGRILTFQCLVLQRAALVGQVSLPLLMRHPSGEIGGIESGGAYEGENFAGIDVEGNRSTRLVSERLGRFLLDVEVDRQHER